MLSANYYGTYAIFQTANKKDAGVLLGADNIIGDSYEIEFLKHQDIECAWLKNRFNQYIGFFDEETSRTFRVLDAKGWSIRAILSLVAFSDSPSPGYYWGEVAIVSLPSTKPQTFHTFVEEVSAQIRQGIRPDLHLGKQAVERLYETEGKWTPSNRVSLPEKPAGTAFLKTRVKPSEMLIEKGRKGTMGCYFLSWAFLLLIVALIVFSLKSCGVF